MCATGYFGDSPLFLLGYLLVVLRVVVLFSIWRTIFVGRTEVGGMTLSATLTYTLIYTVFGGLLDFRTTFTDELSDGQITTRFGRPMHIYGQYIAESLGSSAVSFCLLKIPLFLAASLFGVNPLPHSLVNGAWFLVSLVLAVTVSAAIELILGSLVISLGQGDYSANRLRVAISLLLSGAVLPLAFFPWGLGQLFAWLPFAATASAHSASIPAPAIPCNCSCCSWAGR